MQVNNRLFEDMARLAGGAMGVASALREEVSTIARQVTERLVADMDLVRRDEFEAMREMALNAREEQERLATRIAELEARLASRQSESS